MKKIIRMFFAAMTIVSYASCAGQLGNDINGSVGDSSVEAGELVPMTFSATLADVGDGADGVEVKTTYKSRKVYWEQSDVITVFSMGETVVKASFSDPVLQEDGAMATFTGLVDASAESYYAVYPHADNNAYADGVFTVTIPSVQEGVAEGFVSGSNVSVAMYDKNSAEQNLEFKNACALLAFAFNTASDAANTKSVTLKARKSADDAPEAEFWGLTGTVNMTVNAEGVPVASEGDVDYVTLTAPESGFEVGKVYYVPVSPIGECTGMQVIFTDKDDDVFVKNNNIDFQLLRSYMFNVGKIANVYDILPSEFTVTLDFTQGWPFKDSEGPMAEQVWLGEEYKCDYVYEYNGKSKVFEFIYVITNRGGGDNKAQYSYVAPKDSAKGYFLSTNTLVSNCSGAISIPPVENRYVKQVKVESSAKLNICNDKDNYTGGVVNNVTDSVSPASGVVTFDFPQTKTGVLFGKGTDIRQWAIRCRDKNTKISLVSKRFFDKPL